MTLCRGKHCRQCMTAAAEEFTLLRPCGAADGLGGTARAWTEGEAFAGRLTVWPDGAVLLHPAEVGVRGMYIARCADRAVVHGTDAPMDCRCGHTLCVSRVWMEGVGLSDEQADPAAAE